MSGKDPAIIVNFKVYSEIEGEKALGLAIICDRVAEETGANIIACPPMVELSYVVNQVGIPVYSQNVDPRKPGSGTGFTTPSLVKSAGAAGTLINHSEHKQPAEDVGACVKLCKDLDLVTCVCADTTDIARDLASFSPDYIAVEPPELIGGDVSVTSANPGIVSGTVEAVKSVDRKVKVLCGAGVKNGGDVKTAVDLGAEGVLLASGVVKAANPEDVIRDLIRFV
jgi:triosephosphate isomerase